MTHGKFLLLFFFTLVAGCSAKAHPTHVSITTSKPTPQANESSAPQPATPLDPSLTGAPQKLKQFNFQSRAIAPVVKIQHRYYPITGTSASELRAQMNQQGPFDQREGRRYDARADWFVKWSYRHVKTSNQCKIGSLKTSVDVTLTYPQWTPPPQVSRSLITEWQRYLSALQIHEKGHENNGIAAGKEISQVLSQLPAYSSCQQLDAIVNSTAQTVIKRYNQKDLDYDHATKHGYTQGAVFPASAIVAR